ncbi:MAG: MgtC/SapB family protein [Pirellulaceae bacterium]
MDVEIVLKLFVAAGLGLLVGLQREWTAPHVAGLRTFALITLLGTVIGLLDPQSNGWLISAGLVSVAAMMIVGNVVKFADSEREPGLTTEAAGLVMYLVGVAIALDQMEMGVLVAGGTAVLLHWKKRLHRFVRGIGKEDIRAIIQLVLIGLVILPVLPDETYGPYDVLNPFEIWLIVVLIVGISLLGYIATKFLGTKAGTLLSGILGGVISSTATTISYSRRAARMPESSQLAGVIIAIASTIVFIRVFVEVGIVAPDILSSVTPPLAAMMGLMALISAGMYFMHDREAPQVPTDKHPSELKAAILFGLAYAAVLFIVAAVQENFDDEALYLVAALSGLTEMDAITLSAAQMVSQERIGVDTGWRMILIGFLSNLGFKFAAIALLGPRGLMLRMLVAFGVAFAGGIAIIFFWP